jgi:cell division septation protein DedD
VPLASVISIGGGRVIAVVSSRAAEGSDQRGVLTIRTEIVDSGEAAKVDALSETQDLEIDCSGLRAKAGAMKSYSGRGLTGAVRESPGWASWASAPAGTPLGRMIRAACDPAFRPTFVEAGLTGPAQPKAPALAKPAPAKAKPAPSAPAKAAKAEEAPIEPLAPTPKPKTMPSKAPPEPKAEPTPLEGAVAPAADLGRHLVQIGASRDEAQAKATLAAYRKKAAARMKGHPSAVEKAVIADQTFFRILIGGFDTQSDADAFCEAHKTGGGECMLRER